MNPSNPRRSLRRPSLLIAAPALVLALAAGCSSSKSAAPASTTATTTTAVQVKATPGNEAFCQSYLAAIKQLNDDVIAASQQTNDTTLAAALVPKIKAAYQSLVDAAPADVKPYFDTVNAYTQQAQSLKDLSANSMPTDASAARTIITTWTQSNCGFDPTNVPAG